MELGYFAVMDAQDEMLLREQLGELRSKHRELDARLAVTRVNADLSTRAMEALRAVELTRLTVDEEETHNLRKRFTVLANGGKRWPPW